MKKSVVYHLFIGTFCCLFSLQLSAQSIKEHTVVAGESLYGIARNYQINFNDLVKANPQIQNNAINIGDIIQIPVKTSSTQTTPKIITPTSSPSTSNKNSKTITESNPFAGATGVTNPKPTITKTSITKPSAEPVVTKSGISNNQFPMIEHTVAEKQTLYAVSKLYNVSVDDIKSWNHLADNNIKVGSILLIRFDANSSAVPDKIKSGIDNVPVKSETVQLVKKEEVEESLPVLPEPVIENPVSVSISVQGQLEESYIQEKNKGKSLMTSRGTITWINTENAKMSDSYFALHKTAPIGSIVRITNLVNKRVVFVKVIGKLPETSDNLNITLRLSSAGKKALLLNGDKAYVDIEFYQ